MKREALFGLRFRHWIRSDPQSSAPYELKQTTTDALRFSELKEKQIDWLRAAKTDKGVLIRVQGTSGEPDYAYYSNAPAWVVVRFPTCFCIIDIDAFVKEKESGAYRTLGVARARAIAYKSIDL